MDSPAPASPLLRRSSRRLAWALGALLIAAYAWFLRTHIAPFAGGSDSSGYLNSAALLARGELTEPIPALPGHGAAEFGAGTHVPLGYIPRTETGRMAPSYPLGLPLHLAAWAAPFGLDWAAIPLNLVTALASGGLCYLLARRLAVPAAPALAGAALLLLNPLFLFAALQPMSDLLALAWALAALYAALRLPEGRRWAWLCGLATAVAVLVRPTNLLLGLPILLALGSRWRLYPWVALGGLPGALCLLWYNREVYGAPLASGYGDVWSAFSTAYAAGNLAHFARWLPLLLTPLVLAGIAAPFRAPGRRREWLVLGAWAALLVGFYAFYYHSGETWWYLRFILPAFPVLILALVAALHSFTAGRARGPLLLGGLLAAAFAWSVVLGHRLEVHRNKAGEALYRDSVQWAQTHLPASSAVACMQVSGALHYYTDFLLVRWEQIPPAAIGPLHAALAAQQRPLHAVLYDFEVADAQRRLGGRWTPLERIRQATVWRIEPEPAAP
jgi:hypothetical protein